MPAVWACGYTCYDVLWTFYPHCVINTVCQEMLYYSINVTLLDPNYTAKLTLHLLLKQFFSSMQCPQHTWQCLHIFCMFLWNTRLNGMLVQSMHLLRIPSGRLLAECIAQYPSGLCTCTKNSTIAYHRHLPVVYASGMAHIRIGCSNIKSNGGHPL
ncbi:hypothetical protein HK407_04g07540 [Ordospora pajunii]|uniref:uncharacterized protein n=1 Tax=Ordospora pajunii TaxID=3039483 RepID=UPI00295292C0|nr:uncharacterized protein HK407_04g07540 [Ordospora pajunii]KAH9411647.1 hypothetical protein HK407_04g07540 [Ordospora pajunii]